MLPKGKKIVLLKMANVEFELFAWGSGLNQPSFDPFCLSIEAYLNLIGVDWSVNICHNPNISPTGVMNECNKFNLITR